MQDNINNLLFLFNLEYYSNIRIENVLFLMLCFHPYVLSIIPFVFIRGFEILFGCFFCYFLFLPFLFLYSLVVFLSIFFWFGVEYMLMLHFFSYIRLIIREYSYFLFLGVNREVVSEAEIGNTSELVVTWLNILIISWFWIIVFLS